MQLLNLKGNNITDADLVAISSCINNIDKLSGIEKIILARNLSLRIPQLVEIITKMNEPVIVEINLMYMINNYFLFLFIIRRGVENPSSEANAKDSKKIRGQGQGPRTKFF